VVRAKVEEVLFHTCAVGDARALVAAEHDHAVSDNAKREPQRRPVEHDEIAVRLGDLRDAVLQLRLVDDAGCVLRQTATSTSLSGRGAAVARDPKR